MSFLVVENKTIIGVFNYHPNAPKSCKVYKISDFAENKLFTKEWYFDVDNEEFKKNPMENTKKENIKKFIKNVNTHMNKTSQLCGYNNIIDAISFINSNNKKFKDESVLFSDWRDSVRSLMEENILNYINNDKPLPNITDFCSQKKYKKIVTENFYTKIFGL